MPRGRPKKVVKKEENVEDESKEVKETKEVPEKSEKETKEVVAETKEVPKKEEKETTPKSKGNKRKSTPKETSLKKAKVTAPTVTEIIGDELTQLSLKYWAPLGADQDKSQRLSYNPKIIEDIYHNELKRYNLKRIMLLEVSHYLEK